MRIDIHEVEKRTIASLVDLRGKRILEVGCGVGRETAFLVRPDNSILAIDTDPARIEIARETDLAVNFMCQDFLTTSWQETFDLVVFSMSLHHIDTWQAKLQALLKARAALKPEGKILLIEPALMGEITRIICEFDPGETRGIVDSFKLLNDDSIFIGSKIQGVTAWWEFENPQEVTSFFTTMLRRTTPAITETDVQEALTRLGLQGRTCLSDIIDFYLF